jgi:hypothetical protein
VYLEIAKLTAQDSRAVNKYCVAQEEAICLVLVLVLQGRDEWDWDRSSSRLDDLVKNSTCIAV